MLLLLFPQTLPLPQQAERASMTSDCSFHAVNADVSCQQRFRLVPRLALIRVPGCPQPGKRRRFDAFLTLAFWLAVTLPLSWLNHSWTTVAPFRPGSCASGYLPCFRGLWEIFTRCMVEGYVPVLIIWLKEAALKA